MFLERAVELTEGGLLSPSGALAGGQYCRAEVNLYVFMVSSRNDSWPSNRSKVKR